MNRAEKAGWMAGVVLATSILGAGLFLEASRAQSSGPAHPQKPAAAAQAPVTNDNIIRVEVPVVTVEVVVTDKKETSVRNLTKKDFKIYENGVPQEIANFEYISEEEPTGQFASITTDRPPVPQRQNHILFLFDNLNVKSGDQEVSRQAVDRFLNEDMRPGDWVAIAIFRRSMKILENFTDNKLRLARALSSIVGPENLDPPGATGRAGSAAALDSDALLYAMRDLFNSLRHVPGRKSLIWFSGGISPDDRWLLLSTIDAANKANVTVYTIDATGLNMSSLTKDPELHRSGSGFSPAQLNLGSFMNSFQRPPVGGGSTGGTRGGTGGGTTGGTGGGTTGGRGTGGTTGAGTPRTPPSNTLGNLPPQNRPKDPFSHEGSMSSVKGVLWVLANDTGGSYFRNSYDFNKMLRKVESEMRNYYSLGYASNNSNHDGKYREIKVDVLKKGYNVNYRKGYFDQKPVDPLAGISAEKPLVRAIEAKEPITDLSVKMASGYFYEGTGLARAPVVVQLPVSALGIKREKNPRTNVLDILGVAFSANGSPVARFSDSLPVQVDSEWLKDHSDADSLTIPNYFRLAPGKYHLKVAIHNQGNQIGTAEEDLDIPLFAENQLTTSSLILTNEARELPSLINNLESQLLDDKNPLIFEGKRMYPSVTKKFSQDKPLALYFHTYNLTLDPKLHQPLLLLSVSILSGDKIASQIPLSRVQDLSAVENGRLPVLVWLSLRNLAPGKYTLQVMVRDGITNAKRYLRDQFEIEATARSSNIK
jgi:VWFA-related protein